MRDQLINETQNFEAVVQYQFDFGLRPSLGYVYSKGKDIKGVPGIDMLTLTVDSLKLVPKMNETCWKR